MEENLENICFRDQNFLSIHPLNEENVLAYFSTSQFYDKSCTNEILKMQTMYAAQELTQKELNTNLEKMIGIQFIVDKVLENDLLFIILKIDRYSPKDFEILQAYYILDGNIYQSPTNISIYNSRLTNAYFYLNEALDLFRDRKSFDCYKGFYLKTDDVSTDIPTKKIHKKNFFYRVFNEYVQKDKK